jgi:hypothetical protein
VEDAEALLFSIRIVFFPYPCVFFYPLSLAVPLLQLALAEAASDKVRRQLLDAINSAEDIFHELSHA